MRKISLSLAIIIVLALGCTSDNTPKAVTFKFIDAVLDGDSLAIKQYLDLDQMVARHLKEMPSADNMETPAKLRETILKNLIGDGGTRRHWQNQRLLVNQESIMGDSAQVELTMIDQTIGVTEYSMIYLYRKDGRWLVCFYL